VTLGLECYVTDSLHAAALRTDVVPDAVASVGRAPVARVVNRMAGALYGCRTTVSSTNYGLTHNSGRSLVAWREWKVAVGFVLTSFLSTSVTMSRPAAFSCWR
jgi:hypothetical protein